MKHAEKKGNAAAPTLRLWAAQTAQQKLKEAAASEAEMSGKRGEKQSNNQTRQLEGSLAPKPTW